MIPPPISNLPNAMIAPSAAPITPSVPVSQPRHGAPVAAIAVPVSLCAALFLIALVYALRRNAFNKRPSMPPNFDAEKSTSMVVPPHGVPLPSDRAYLHPCDCLYSHLPLHQTFPRRSVPKSCYRYPSGCSDDPYTSFPPALGYSHPAPTDYLIPRPSLQRKGTLHEWTRPHTDSNLAQDRDDRESWLKRKLSVFRRNLEDEREKEREEGREKLLKERQQVDQLRQELWETRASNLRRTRSTKVRPLNRSGASKSSNRYSYMARREKIGSCAAQDDVASESETESSQLVVSKAMQL
jgi:hypothetical protein